MSCTPNREEIKVIVSTKGVGDEVNLVKLFQNGRVTGICSERPSSSWGMTLGPKLVQANAGRPLSSAWLVEEMSEPPSADLVTGILAGSAGCFAATLILATIVFWKAD